MSIDKKQFYRCIFAEHVRFLRCGSKINFIHHSGIDPLRIEKVHWTFSTRCLLLTLRQLLLIFDSSVAISSQLVRIDINEKSTG